MEKEVVNQVQEAERVSGRINPRRNTLKHIVIKMMAKIPFINFSELYPCALRTSLIAPLIKNPPAMQKILVRFLGQEYSLEKG